MDPDLDVAHIQGTDYFDGLSESELPHYVIVADFQRLRLYDLEENTTTELKLSELPSHIPRFGFIAGYTKIKARDEDPPNIKAVQLLGELHDALSKTAMVWMRTARPGMPCSCFWWVCCSACSQMTPAFSRPRTAFWNWLNELGRIAPTPTP